MDRIDITCLYNSNAFPLVRFMVDGVCYANEKIKTKSTHFSVNLEDGKHTFEIEHYGKNYEKDSDPDRYFELVGLMFNGIDFNYVIHDIKQYPILPPWEGKEKPNWNDLRLGYNGRLVLEFEAPIGIWFRKKFDIINPMVGQETTWEYLKEAKEIYGKYNGL